MTTLQPRAWRWPPAAASALAPVFALGLAAGAAHADVTLGGTLDLATRHVRNGDLGSTSSVVSGANTTSKLVIRGQEDLGGGLAAGFFLDSTILADSGTTSSTFWDRRATVGLTHRRYGEVRMGRDWVPTQLVWNSMDPFATLGIAGANTFRSVYGSRAMGQAFGSNATGAAQNPTLRVANAVEYLLPGGLGGFNGALIATAGEGGSAGAGQTKGDGFRLGWAQGAWKLGVSQFTVRNAAADDKFTDRVWGVGYDAGFALFSVAQRRWAYASDTTVNSLFGVSVPMGAGQLKLTVLRADQTGATDALSANDATLLGVGYVYSLSKRTALYAHAARLSNQGGASFAIAGGPATSGVATAANYFGGQRSTGFELGMRQDF
ncbi:porin [Rubrivivax gelatinosus]|uniref:Putative porin n=1 Tax=Rubrivivax gelatinosus TaxID=28068 RepID=A0A4R2LUX8_RUBGE|nr:porin [Rubrivivax gelatinosus]MBK1689842.1 porin [Rubrivivax gelatinosus]TCO97149.1 putative porin [Rubrivivax gelatinosus]